MQKQAYPWYGSSKAGDKPEQGDFLNGLPIVQIKEALPIEGSAFTPQVIVYDVVILTQSCDLEHGKVNRIQVAPVATLKEFLKVRPGYNTVEMLENLRKNNFPRYYLLNVNRSNKFNKLGYLVVDFGSVHSISKKTLEAMCGQQPERRKLLSPYREQLSQHFARFYMRVGLPDDIRPFTVTERL